MPSEPSVPLEVSLRRWVGVLAIAASAGCAMSSAAELPFVIADWQVRCDSATPDCTEPRAHGVTGTDGERGNQIRCRVTETDVRRLDLEIQGTFDEQIYGVSLDLTLPEAIGGAATGTATVLEGLVSYSGAVGTGPITETQPCEASVNIYADVELEASVISVELFCDHLLSVDGTDERRRFTSHLDPGQPASLVVYRCEGLRYEP